MKVQSQFIEMFGNPLSDVQKYNIKPLGECCIINPRRANINLGDNDEVSFVPMQSVSEDGNLQDVKAEAFSKVKKGFTYFENNDVLFAKITPCMENGKGAIAQDLTNGIGMGSTEFHVLRPVQGKSNPYWLLALTRMPIFRERASKNMSGTGGQKRVPTTFLENFKIGLPPIEEQEKFESLYKQADKSKFVGFKSQFIEMFGTVEEPKVSVKELIDVALGSGQYGSNTSATDYQEGMPRYIRITDINDDGSLNNDIKTAEVIDEKYKLSTGDIVFARTGATVGKTYLHESGDAIYAGYLIKYQMNPAYMEPLFMKAYTHSKTYYSWVANTQKVGAQPNISATQYDKMPVLVPSIEEQASFLAIYKQADKSKFELNKSIEAIDAVIKSLINN